MADYHYTFVTVNGDVNLTTDSHHTHHDSIEEFIEAHKSTIDAALKVASIVVSVYVSHNRAGTKIK